VTARWFRKLPVVVEAVQWTGDNIAELYAWTGGRFRATDVVHQATSPGITGEVLDVLHSTWVGVRTGHWVVKGIKGEHYPIDNVVLAETYEEVTTDA
jgi:hypothetical protein